MIKSSNNISTLMRKLVLFCTLSVINSEISTRAKSQDLRISTCNDAPHFKGYPSIDSFIEDWVENKTATLLLCPGIEYESTEALELTAVQNVLTISCLDILQTCEWKAVGSHLHVKPQEGLTVLVKGVTFTSSTESSIIIEVDALTFMSLVFIDCIWKVCPYIVEHRIGRNTRRST